MKEKEIDPKDYYKTFFNACSHGKFEGCLFIYDDNFNKKYRDLEAYIRVTREQHGK